MPTDFMIFMAIFNFLEPGVTIIAQAIPMFRVLIVNGRIRGRIRFTMGVSGGKGTVGYI